MATDRAQMHRSSSKGRGKTGIVRRGTKGMYDLDENVRSQTARAMVASRATIEVMCVLDDCDHGENGEPKIFRTRLVDGQPEAKACCSAHRLKLWRRSMDLKGYEYKTVNGVLGWATPDGRFYPAPSQPQKRHGRVTYIRGNSGSTDARERRRVWRRPRRFGGKGSSGSG